MSTEAPKPSGEGVLKAGVCPRCGWRQEQTVLNPEESIKREFVRCLLAGRPYKHTYLLYGGQLKVEFEALTTDQSDTLSATLSELQETYREKLQDPVFGNQAQLLFNTEATQLRMFAALRLVGSKVYPYPQLMGIREWKEGYQKVFGGMPNELGALLLRAYLEFHRLTLLLVEHSCDPSFWRGAGYA